MGQRLENATALYLEGIRDGRAAEAIATYTGSRYTQHSTPVKDGREGFLEFFADFLQRNPVRDIEILRGFEDGRYVFLHAAQRLNGGEHRYVTADIFDTDDDAKLIEHWDMIAEMPETTRSGHTPVDGPTDAVDLKKTEQNKALVRGFLDEVLVAGRHEALGVYVGEEYVEHGTRGRDGIEALRSLVTDPDRPVRYEAIHLVIGSGSLVAALAQASIAGMATAVIDLFRVDSGHIVEHWEVSEEITPRETWVNSGKF